MTTALLERAETLLDTFTDKVIIRKDRPSIIRMDCGQLGDPCDTFAQCCQFLGLRACEAGICVT
ncbi:hypothetical protein [Nocardia sp. NPDC051570]|uniref:hypothetical protein n=1 Tax=Nocardia sp. NPDC051570 TaxID=3364324 RepID=UPI0037984154